MYPIEKGKCPYCKHTLSPIPKRKTKCLYCGNTIYVRTLAFKRKQKYLITEEEYNKIEMQRKEQDRIARDKKWQQLNADALKAMKKDDLQELSQVYLEQALILYNEGKDFFSILKCSREENLKYMLSMGVEKVQILAAKDSCANCKALNGKVFSIADAIKNSYLPCEKCTHGIKSEKGFCRCIYLPYFENQK